MTSSFQEELAVPPLSSCLKNVIEQCPAYAVTTKLFGRAHGLHFTFRWREFLQRSATEQYFALPRGPEGYARRPELLGVECEHLIFRSDFVHVPQVFLKESKHLRPGYVVELNAHAQSPCGLTSALTAATGC